MGETAALDLSPTIPRPLDGVRVALTGTPAIQDRLRRPLLDLGARPFSLMTTQVVEQETNFDWGLLAQGPNWVVLTSQNGVECFFRTLDRANVDLRTLASCRFAVIGPATGAALRRRGISADLCPEVHTTQGLADALLERISPGEPVRLFRSQLGSRSCTAAWRSASRRRTFLSTPSGPTIWTQPPSRPGWRGRTTSSSPAPAGWTFCWIPA